MIKTDRMKEFEEWLRRAGADVMPCTNPYELLRFVAHGATHVVYKDKWGCVTSIPDFVEKCWNAFLHGGHVDMGITKKPRSNTERKKMALFQRDGNLCFFCQIAMTFEEASVEHLVAVQRGGPTNLDNLVLAHAVCNQKAGNAPLMDKIKLHVENKIKLTARNSAICV